MTAQEIDYSTIDEVAEDGVRIFKVLMQFAFALNEVGDRLRARSYSLLRIESFCDFSTISEARRPWLREPSFLCCFLLDLFLRA